MKAFLSACILFLILFAGSIANDIHLAHIARSMKEEAISLTTQEMNSEGCAKILAQWEEERWFFSLSMHYNELEALETAMTRAEAAQKTKSDSDYYIAVAELADTLSRLQELNALSPFGLF